VGIHEGGSVNRTLAADKQRWPDARAWKTSDTLALDAKPWFKGWADRVPAYRAHLAIIESIEASGVADSFEY
jgi:hypothetical protein